MAEKINISMAGDRRMRNVASVWRYLVYPSIGLKDHSCICFIPECRTLGLVIRGWSMQTGWNLSEWQEWPEANCCNIYPAGNKTKRPYRPPPINRTFQRLMKGKTLRGGERQKHLNCNSVFFRLYCLFLEDSSNPPRIKSLRGSSKNEVMNWQPFWFLHLCIKCTDVQRTYAKIRFFTEYAKHLLFFFSNKYKYC